MAVTLTAEEVATATGAPEADAVRLLEVAAALVERFAPDAPEPVQDEAAVRVAGWLHGMPHSSIGSERAGELEVGYMRSHLSALRHSGAMALLSTWKVRRAGAI